jgi:hypothetical protein
MNPMDFFNLPQSQQDSLWRQMSPEQQQEILNYAEQVQQQQQQQQQQHFYGQQQQQHFYGQQQANPHFYGQQQQQQQQQQQKQQKQDFSQLTAKQIKILQKQQLKKELLDAKNRGKSDVLTVIRESLVKKEVNKGEAKALAKRDRLEVANEVARHKQLLAERSKVAKKIYKDTKRLEKLQELSSMSYEELHKHNVAAKEATKKQIKKMAHITAGVCTLGVYFVARGLIFKNDYEELLS